MASEGTDDSETQSSHSTNSVTCNEVVAVQQSGDDEQNQQSAEIQTPSRASKTKGKKKFEPTKNTNRKRDKKAKKEKSEVWEHFTKFDKPLLEVVDGKEIVVGSTKRAQCKYYCSTHLACDSRENGTSSLRKHIELVCKGYPDRNNLEESQQILTSDVFDQKCSLVSRQWSEDACLDATCVMIVLDELPFS
ncbi:zinc finger BED domain-containing protein RICESLEEPER 4-like [Rosa rugosa]|uniref:zinc finger BED domain-containing protein RICESLEEPER 4-like n=1 Tax=Rosa rugosa TaxID=74645 RepID=UPI002B40D797|nr:zinc finger BED domain-containing protein RICESLEEPER 4-like [Rosa rugosa]